MQSLLRVNVVDLMNDETIKQLTKQWYDRLKQEGFKDIEDVKHPNKPLIVWHSLKWKRLTKEKKEAIELYYFKARELLHSFTFENEIHKRIWELHAEGVSKRKIEKEIKTLGSTLKRERIGIIIQSIAAEIK